MAEIKSYGFNWAEQRRRGKSHVQAIYRQYCNAVGDHIETTVADGLKTEKYRMPGGKVSLIVSRASEGQTP